MAGQGLKFCCNDSHYYKCNGYNKNKRCMPSPTIGQVKTNGNTQHLARAKSHLDKAHRSSSLLKWKQVRHDRKRNRTNDTSKNSGDHSGCCQHRVGCSECAAKRSCSKSAVEKQ